MEGDQGVNLVEYPDAEMMMIDLANQIAGELGTALRQQETASLAVPGGTTPGPIFDALCDAAFFGRNREYALGGGPEQRFMGKWSDGTPVKELVVTDRP